MEYLGIKSLLNRFNKKLLEKNETEEVFIEVIKNVSGIVLDKDCVSFKNKKIKLSVRSLLKTEIMLKKEKILGILKNKGFSIENIE